MKLAITVWNGRVAPVFDVAERCVLVHSEAPETEVLLLPATTEQEKAEFLEKNGITTLVCGAISKVCENAVIERNIEVVSFLAGPIDLVIEAWKENRLIQTGFSMPGCGCPRRRCRRRGNRINSNLNL